MKFFTDIHGPQRVNPNDFNGPHDFSFIATGANNEKGDKIWN